MSPYSQIPSPSWCIGPMEALCFLLKGFQSDTMTWKRKNVEMSSLPEDCQEYSRDLQYQILMFHNHKISGNYSNFLVNLIKSSHNVLTTSDLVQIYLTQIVWIGLLRNSFPVKHLVASSPHYLCKGELMQGKINCESFWKPNGYKFF